LNRSKDGMTAGNPRRGVHSIAIMLACFAAYLIADLWTKEWALENLSRPRTGEVPPVCAPDENGRVMRHNLPLPPRDFIPGLLELRYAENCGAAFSIMRTAPAWFRTTVIGLAAVAATVVLSVLFLRGSGGRPFAAAVPLVLAGALGNLIDRIRHGFVVDFLLVDPDLFTYPVFNVADILIAIGMGLLLIEGFMKRRPENPTELARGRSVG
jgi:signal peptidase II